MNDEERQRVFQSGSKAFSRMYQPRSSETSKPSYATLQNKKPAEQISSNALTDEEKFLEGIPFNTLKIGENLHLEQIRFKETDLHSNLLSAFEKLGYVNTNEVQMKVLNFFSEFTKLNLKICAPRKCGKTTAVLMCCINKILKAHKNTLQLLIVCPTLELAELCYTLTQKLIKFCSLNVCYAVKGKNFNKNVKVKEDIIIATPEKALEIATFHDLKRIQYFFIDDADCLKNPKSNFQSFTKLCRKLSPYCQIIVAADLENKFVEEFLKGSELLCHDISIKNTTSYRNIKQYFAVHNQNHPDEKFEFIAHFLKTKKYHGQAIICSEMKSVVAQLEENLRSQEIEAVKLHGDLSATKRQEILQQFNQNEIKVLITTQAFLRVVDSDNVTQLINTEQLFDTKEGLTLEEYDRRRCVLNVRKPGIFISFIEDGYQEFFFADKETDPNGKTYFHGSEITTVESLKRMVSK